MTGCCCLSCACSYFELYYSRSFIWGGGRNDILWDETLPDSTTSNFIVSRELFFFYLWPFKTHCINIIFSIVRAGPCLFAVVRALFMLFHMKPRFTSYCYYKYVHSDAGYISHLLTVLNVQSRRLLPSFLLEATRTNKNVQLKARQTVWNVNTRQFCPYLLLIVLVKLPYEGG